MSTATSPPPVPAASAAIAIAAASRPGGVAAPTIMSSVGASAIRYPFGAKLPASPARAGTHSSTTPRRLGGSRLSPGMRILVLSRRADGLVAPGRSGHAGEAEMIAQRPPPIGPPEEAPALQFGDDEIDEIGKAAGEIGRQNVEPVGRTLDKPFFER